MRTLVAIVLVLGLSFGGMLTASPAEAHSAYRTCRLDTHVHSGQVIKYLRTYHIPIKWSGGVATGWAVVRRHRHRNVGAWWGGHSVNTTCGYVYRV